MYYVNPTGVYLKLRDNYWHIRTSFLILALAPPIFPIFMFSQLGNVLFLVAIPTYWVILFMAYFLLKDTLESGGNS